MGAAVGGFKMMFDSLSAFAQMGGHGLYVWAAYGVTAFVVALNLYWPKLLMDKFRVAEEKVIARQPEKLP